MTRRCRIDDCTTPALTGRHLCSKHKQRIAHHGDPHFTTWTTADDHDIAALIRDPRPARHLTRLERIKVGRGWSQKGVPATEIARLLQVDPRTVYRWRAQRPRQAA